MTDLHKTIRRRSREQFAHYRKRIVISLEPGDVIGMRLERTRTTYRAPLPVCSAYWPTGTHAPKPAPRKKPENLNA